MQRIYVERRAYDEFLGLLLPRVEALKVGDPADEETDVGPLISESDRDRILSWIEGEIRGAVVLTGGELDGELLLPTVIAEAPTDAKVSCEEVFGPLCTVTPFDTLDEAIDLANSTRSGFRPGFHARRQECASRGAKARVRWGDGKRGADLPRRPDAIRRDQGLREHARRPGLRDPRDDRRAPRRPPALVSSMCRQSRHEHRRDSPTDGRIYPTSSASSNGSESHFCRYAKRLRDLGGLALEMYKRDRFSAGLVVERCAELVAIEASPRDRRPSRRKREAPPRDGHVRLRRAVPPRRTLLRDVRALRVESVSAAAGAAE